MLKSNASGPLSGYRFIEIAGIGPTQMTGMLLADMGADIIRIERLESADLGITMPTKYDLLNRSRRSARIDLKSSQGVETVLRLCEKADAFYEGFRPGVMERLGLGPEVCMGRNPALVYGRMTGWGQEGSLAKTAGHDPDYIGIAGALSLIGEPGGAPVFPLNLVGDAGGGALYLAMGLVAALLEKSKSGKGQVVDAAMVDGVASILTFIYGLHAAGIWNLNRGTNILDGASHFVHTYKTKDDRYVTVGALEPKFYHILLDKLAIDDTDIREQQMNQERWQEFSEKLQTIFITKTRDEWCAIFTGSDACFAPVLTLDEATQHPHAKERKTYETVAGITQPGPAPRFSRTQSRIQSPPAEPGEHTESALLDWGFSETEIAELTKQNIIRGIHHA